MHQLEKIDKYMLHSTFYLCKKSNPVDIEKFEWELGIVVVIIFVTKQL